MDVKRSREEVVECEALLPSPIDLNSISSLSDSEITQYRDSRGYKLLMIASEAGHIEAVKNLISRGEEVNDEVDGENAASLGFSKGHHEVVLTLLKANSKFPKNYQHETASDELKAFVDLSTKMHENVKEENLEELQELLRENFGLKYFYNVNNKSLLRTAIVHKKFEIYEFLLTSNIFLAPHESIDLLMEKISDRSRKKFSEINFKLSPELVTEPMMILLRNCKLGPDNDPNGDYMNFTHKAFDFLFKIPLIAIVLKVVAAYRNFSIVFDFNRDSVTFLDPQTEPYTNGLFYSSGKIFIAAKDMLDPSKVRNTIAVIAHEFCHFAMLLVYENFAMPYKDGKGELFETINRECKDLKDEEEIVNFVYENYDEEMHHAELIVRVPQMLALYSDNEEILNKTRKSFSSLFKFYEEVCVPEMEAELPNIENKFNPFIKSEQRIKKLRRWIGFLAFLMLCIIGGSIWLSIQLHNPILSWSELSKDQQIKLKNSQVEYYGTNVKFGELFANDSGVYKLLSSEQIKEALNGDTKELSKALNVTLKSLVYLSWTNMTEKLQNKFLTCKVDFQGQNVTLGDIFNQTKKSLNLVFDHLSPKKIRKVFKGKFSISKETRLKVKFYIERDFIVESVKTFGIPIKVENIITEIEETKVFLLSSVAGEGKSTTMRHLTRKMKEKYPTKWVQFIKLKKYLKVFKKYANLNFTNSDSVRKFISKKLLDLKGFKYEVFKKLFKANQIVFLWDGIDEVSPLYLNLMMNLTSSIEKSSKNIQFLSTRPQYSKNFQESLNISSYKLIPLDEDEIREFCIKFIAFENFKVNGDVVYDFVERKLNHSHEGVSKELSNALNISQKTLNEILHMINKSSTVLELITNDENDLIENPLFVRMVTEIITDFDFNANSSLNLYQFYTIFVHKKFDIIEVKEKTNKNETSKIKTTSNDNIMMRIHQAYTLKMNLINNDDFDNNHEFMMQMAKLEILKATNLLSAADISRFGILHVNSDETFAFTHSTFGEYFLIRFVIDFFSKEVIKPEPGDIVPVMLMFRLTACDDDEENFSCKLFRGFLSSETNLSPIMQKIKVKILRETQTYDDIETLWYLEFFNLLQTNYNNGFKYFSRFFIDEANLEESFDLCKEDDDEEFYESLDSQMVYFMFSFPLNNNQTLIHVAFSTLVGKENCSETFVKTLDEIIAKISKEQFLDLLFTDGNDDGNTFTFAFSEFDYETLQTFWNFIEKHFDSDERKTILDMRENSCGNAFYFMSINENENISLLMKEIIESLKLSDDDVRDFLMAMRECPTILFGLLRNYELVDIEWMLKYLDINDENDKEYLIKFLSKRDEDGETIFGIFKESGELKPFYEILKNVSVGKKLYEEELKQLEFPSLLIKFVEDYSDDLSVKDLRSFNWTYTDFVYLRHKWRTIKSRMSSDIKKLMLSGNNLKESLIIEVAKIDVNIYFLSKVKSVLSKDQLPEVLTRSNVLNQTALMFAASSQKQENFKGFFKFYEENLKKEMFKQFLLYEDNSHYTVLHYSTWNDDPGMFPLVLKIFEKFFTRDKCLEILSNVKQDNLSFFERMLELKSNTFINSMEVIKKLFVNATFRLQKLLTLRNLNGSTIFSKHQYNENLKHLEYLLRFTFDGPKNKFEHFISLQRIRSKFAKGLELNHKVDQLRSFEWTFDDFNFLFLDLEEVKKKLGNDYRKFLVSRGTNDESLFITLVGLNNSEILTKNFLKQLDEHLSQVEIFDFLFSTDKKGESAFMAALHVEVLWDYFGKFSNGQKRKLLMQKTKLKNTALQFATWKNRSSVFTETIKIYRNIFTSSEIQEILLDLSSVAIPLKSAIEDQNMQRNREIINFLRETFKNEKLKLIKFLSHRTDSFGDTIFSNSDEKNENLELYKELLKEIYEGDDFESFYEYLQYKTLMPKYLMSRQIDKIEYPWEYPEFFYFVNYFDEIRSKIHDDGIKKLLGVHQN